MKSIAKLIFIALAIMLPAVSFGQKDVTKFLGIPVDGTKSEMIRKLQAKGFKLVKDPYGDDEHLEGEFNGEDVNVYVVTNNDKVYRIHLTDKAYRDETEIKSRFNNLVVQFAINSKYKCATDSYTSYIIPDYEDISQGMTVLNKEYSASFYQNDTDSAKVLDDMKNMFSGFTEEEFTKLTGYIQQIRDIDTDISPNEDFLPTDPKVKELLILIMKYHLRKNVWFTIGEYYGGYKILMYYDNILNQANGEDL